VQRDAARRDDRRAAPARCGPRGLSKRADSSAAARFAARAGSAVASPSAPTDGPWASKRARANESGCALTSSRIAPCAYSRTSLLRWRPGHPEAELLQQPAECVPMRLVDGELDEGEPVERGHLRRVEQLAALRRGPARPRRRARPRRAGAAAPGSPRYSSERIASVAVRRFGVSRKTSLKISSDSGPA
jgi:hypothetical protein